ncbi:MAG TPA: manganese efflux pump [Solirubrobacteraceae bacterium]|nr:manganese efflux pump [Solirubrobacteraceae bacterium]
MVERLVALVLPLGVDTLVVAAALGAAGIPPRDQRRVRLLFPAFEAGMPLIGLALGAPLGHLIGGAANYVAIGVLFVLGLCTLLGSDDEDEARLAEAIARPGLRLVLLGLSISLDELAIGFALGLLRLPVILVLVLIGLQAVLVTQLGLRLGDRLHERLREVAERLAGGVLVVVALALVAERLAG